MSRASSKRAAADPRIELIGGVGLEWLSEARLVSRDRVKNDSTGPPTQTTFLSMGTVRFTSSLQVLEVLLKGGTQRLGSE